MAPQAIIINSTTSGVIRLSEQGNLSFRTVANGLELIVGSKIIFIPKSTSINRDECDIWWSVEYGSINTLRLINSTPSDVTTIHRLLSSISPDSPAQMTSASSSPEAGHSPSNNKKLNTRTPFYSSPNFRNSLVLVDEDENPVAIMNLKVSSPAFAPLTKENSSHSVRGEQLAKTVDDISNHLFGRDDKLDNENRRRKEELEDGHQTPQDGLKSDSSSITLLSPPIQDTSSSTSSEIFIETSSSFTSDAFNAKSEISNSFTDTSSTTSLPSSSISILSIATKGTHDCDMSDISETETTGETNYATATEGGEAEQDSRPTSILSIETVTYPASLASSALLSDQVEDDVTPQQSKFNTVQSTTTTTTSFLNHPLSPSYTGSNAVLLEFLGNQSTFTTRQITTEEIDQKGLVRAAAEIDAKGSWNWIGVGLSEVIKGLKSWLGIENWFMESSSIHKPKSVEEIRKGRLSVLYFDEQGFGRKAYVAGRIGK